MNVKHIWFNGIKFTRDNSTGYYLNSTIHERLHRYVWKFNNGSIPLGYAIHHIDKDKSNNDIRNLKLMTQHDHQSLHSKERDYDWLVNNLAGKARPAASIWHGSQAGRTWHKKHYEEMKDKMFVEKEYVCLECGKNFKSTKGYNVKFCSNKCKSAWRRKAGLDNEQRKCVVCGKEFTANKYKNVACCSKQCVAIFRKDNRCKSKIG